MDNFICNKCSKTKSYTKYSITASGKYLHNNKQIICEECDTPLEYRKELEKEGVPLFGVVGSMNSEQRTKYFDKRAKDNFKKHGRDEKMERLKKSGIDW